MNLHFSVQACHLCLFFEAGTDLCFFFLFLQMLLHLAEASRHFGCTEIFREPSKFALSDCYEEHFLVPYKRIVMVTNKRVVLLQVKPTSIRFHLQVFHLCLNSILLADLLLPFSALIWIRWIRNPARLCGRCLGRNLWRWNWQRQVDRGPRISYCI